MKKTKLQYKEMYKNIKRYCNSCSNFIVRDKRSTYKQYLEQKFCSIKCHNISKIESSKEENNPNWSGGKIELNCYQCKKSYFTNSYKSKTSHFCSEQCRSSYNSKGERHWNWQGGLTDINLRERGLKVYRLWREAVFKRDNYTCLDCGDNKGGNLNADHIKPFSLYPELRFAIDNGRTLCETCHKKTDTWGGKISILKKELNYEVL